MSKRDRFLTGNNRVGAAYTHIFLLFIPQRNKDSGLLRKIELFTGSSLI